MNKKLLVLIIGGFFVGIGLAWFLVGRDFKLPDFFRPNREEVNRIEIGEKREDSSPSSTIKKKPIMKKNGSLEDSGNFSNLPESFSEAISVESQGAGLEVAIKKVVHKESVWVAIYDELNGGPTGTILGAGRFRKGMDEGVVPLLRKTEAGKTYFTVIHEDDGDNSFDFKSSDPPLKNLVGGLIMARFEVFESGDLPAILKGGCVVSGCNGQICSDQDVETACEFRPEYACYKNAICERQSSGKCGWTKTEELLECLNMSL